MPWQSERTTINQKVQLGVESTSALGTAVPANKTLLCYQFQTGISTDISSFTATGRKYPAIVEENQEWVDVSVSGNLDYNGAIYPLASVMGSVTPTTHGSSATAKDWIFTPPVTGSIVPQTYTIEQGDANHSHRFVYGLFTNWAYKGTRKDFSCSAKMIAQPITDNITMTSSPTAVALMPVVAKQANVYLDPTYSALGTTLLTRVLSVDYSMDGVYGPLWVLNRANLGWVAHVDLMPKATIKLKVEADSNGMALLGYLQNSTTMFLRVDAQGPVIDNQQTISLGTPSAGNFTLTYKGQTTGNIAYNATSSAVQTAFQALSTVGTNATVSGGAGGPYTVTFSGTLATDTTAITGNGAGLTGGTFLITQSQVYNKYTHDMAIKIGKPSAFADDQGVFAVEWECPIVEDSTWGKSQVFTITNLLASL